MCRNLILIVLLSFSIVAPTQARPRTNRLAGDGAVHLPYTVNDNTGNNWMIYQGGWLQQQGNQPVYSQGAMLTINGGQPNMQQNTARLDEKTGELVLENMNANNNVLVTRRILV